MMKHTQGVALICASPLVLKLPTITLPPLFCFDGLLQFCRLSVYSPCRSATRGGIFSRRCSWCSPFDTIIRQCITCQFRFDFFDRGHAGIKRLGRCAYELVFRHTDRFIDTGQSVFCDQTVLLFAQQQADGGFIVGGLDLGIHG